MKKIDKRHENAIKAEYCISHPILNKLARDRFEGNRSAAMRACLLDLFDREEEVVSGRFHHHSPIVGLNLTKITIRLTEGIVYSFRDLAARSGYGKSEVLRITLEEYLEGLKVGISD